MERKGPSPDAEIGLTPLEDVIVATTGGVTAENTEIGTKDAEAAVAAADIIVSMMKKTVVGTGILAADIGLNLHPLHHLLRVVGLLPDHQTIRKEKTSTVAEVTPDAVEGMIAEAVRKVHLLMFILTSNVDVRKNPSYRFLVRALILTNPNVSGMVSNGLFVLHNRYRLLTYR